MDSKGQASRDKLRPMPRGIRRTRKNLTQGAWSLVMNFFRGLLNALLIEALAAVLIYLIFFWR
jgi:hypothetical protein